MVLIHGTRPWQFEHSCYNDILNISINSVLFDLLSLIIAHHSIIISFVLAYVTWVCKFVKNVWSKQKWQKFWVERVVEVWFCSFCSDFNNSFGSLHKWEYIYKGLSMMKSGIYPLFPPPTLEKQILSTRDRLIYQNKIIRSQCPRAKWRLRLAIHVCLLINVSNSPLTSSNIK